MRAKRHFAKATLTVDSYPGVTARSRGAHSRLNAGDALYLGGAPNIPRQTHGRFADGFVGCISHAMLGKDFHVPLVREAKEGMNIEICRV